MTMLNRIASESHYSTGGKTEPLGIERLGVIAVEGGRAVSQGPLRMELGRPGCLPGASWLMYAKGLWENEIGYLAFCLSPVF